MDIKKRSKDLQLHLEKYQNRELHSWLGYCNQVSRSLVLKTLASVGEHPKPLPDFDLAKIGIMEVYGSILFEEKDEDKKDPKSDSRV